MNPPIYRLNQYVNNAYWGRDHETVDRLTKQAEERINGLFDAIAHGDPMHRAWLRLAISNHFHGKPIPKEFS